MKMDADTMANTADERALDERRLLEQSIEQHESELREAVDDLTAPRLGEARSSHRLIG